jgi:septal ring factor EnvC (AmiA/AmiB activator)
MTPDVWEAVGVVAAAILAAVGLIAGAFAWTAKMGRSFERLENADTNHTRELSDTKHALKNQTNRIDALEHARTGDIERLVKLETAVANVDKSLERIERGQDKLKTELVDIFNSRMDQHAESIREIRDRGGLGPK